MGGGVKGQGKMTPFFLIKLDGEQGDTSNGKALFYSIGWKENCQSFVQPYFLAGVGGWDVPVQEKTRTCSEVMLVCMVPQMQLVTK